MHEASVVATELALKLKKSLRDWRVRIGLITFGVVLISGMIIYRYVPKPDQAKCAFKIGGTALPETQGDAYKIDDCVTLEVVSTNSARTLGLSGRESMPREHGMLFDFKVADEYCMWMKEMHFSLDMIWLNERKEIVNILEGISPETYPKSFCGPSDARYVVEVNAGVVKAGDLRVGQRLRF